MDPCEMELRWRANPECYIERYITLRSQPKSPGCIWESRLVPTTVCSKSVPLVCSLTSRATYYSGTVSV